VVGDLVRIGETLDHFTAEQSYNGGCRQTGRGVRSDRCAGSL
jgi:hypothetical protein